MLLNYRLLSSPPPLPGPLTEDALNTTTEDIPEVFGKDSHAPEVFGKDSSYRTQYVVRDWDLPPNNLSPAADIGVTCSES